MAMRAVGDQPGHPWKKKLARFSGRRTAGSSRPADRARQRKPLATERCVIARPDQDFSILQHLSQAFAELFPQDNARDLGR